MRKLFLFFLLFAVSSIGVFPDPAHATWSTVTIDNSGTLGYGTDSSIAIDSNRKSHISYYDSTNGDLK